MTTQDITVFEQQINNQNNNGFPNNFDALANINNVVNEAWKKNFDRFVENNLPYPSETNLQAEVTNRKNKIKENWSSFDGTQNTINNIENNILNPTKTKLEAVNTLINALADNAIKTKFKEKLSLTDWNNLDTLISEINKYNTLLTEVNKLVQINQSEIDSSKNGSNDLTNANTSINNLKTELTNELNNIVTTTSNEASYTDLTKEITNKLAVYNGIKQHHMREDVLVFKTFLDELKTAKTGNDAATIKTKFDQWSSLYTTFKTGNGNLHGWIDSHKTLLTEDSNVTDTDIKLVDQTHFKTYENLMNELRSSSSVEKQREFNTTTAGKYHALIDYLTVVKASNDITKAAKIKFKDRIYKAVNRSTIDTVKTEAQNFQRLAKGSKDLLNSIPGVTENNKSYWTAEIEKASTVEEITAVRNHINEYKTKLIEVQNLLNSFGEESNRSEMKNILNNVNKVGTSTDQQSLMYVQTQIEEFKKEYETTKNLIAQYEKNPNKSSEILSNLKNELKTVTNKDKAIQLRSKISFGNDKTTAIEFLKSLSDLKKGNGINELENFISRINSASDASTIEQIKKEAILQNMKEAASKYVGTLSHLSTDQKNNFKTEINAKQNEQEINTVKDNAEVQNRKEEIKAVVDTIQYPQNNADSTSSKNTLKNEVEGINGSSKTDNLNKLTEKLNEINEFKTYLDQKKQAVERLPYQNGTEAKNSILHTFNKAHNKAELDRALPNDWHNKVEKYKNTITSNFGTNHGLMGRLNKTYPTSTDGFNEDNLKTQIIDTKKANAKSKINHDIKNRHNLTDQMVNDYINRIDAVNSNNFPTDFNALKNIDDIVKEAWKKNFDQFVNTKLPYPTENNYKAEVTKRKARIKEQWKNFDGQQSTIDRIERDILNPTKSKLDSANNLINSITDTNVKNKFKDKLSRTEFNNLDSIINEINKYKSLLAEINKIAAINNDQIITSNNGQNDLNDANTSINTLRNDLTTELNNIVNNSSNVNSYSNLENTLAKKVALYNDIKSNYMRDDVLVFKTFLDLIKTTKDTAKAQEVRNKYDQWKAQWQRFKTGSGELHNYIKNWKETLNEDSRGNDSSIKIVDQNHFKTYDQLIHELRSTSDANKIKAFNDTGAGKYHAVIDYLRVLKDSHNITKNAKVKFKERVFAAQVRRPIDTVREEAQNFERITVEAKTLLNSIIGATEHNKTQWNTRINNASTLAEITQIKNEIAEFKNLFAEAKSKLDEFKLINNQFATQAKQEELTKKLNEVQTKDQVNSLKNMIIDETQKARQKQYEFENITKQNIQKIVDSLPHGNKERERLEAEINKLKQSNDNSIDKWNKILSDAEQEKVKIAKDMITKNLDKVLKNKGESDKIKNDIDKTNDINKLKQIEKEFIDKGKKQLQKDLGNTNDIETEHIKRNINSIKTIDDVININNQISLKKRKDEVRKILNNLILIDLERFGGAYARSNYDKVLKTGNPETLYNINNLANKLNDAVTTEEINKVKQYVEKQRVAEENDFKARTAEGSELDILRQQGTHYYSYLKSNLFKEIIFTPKREDDAYFNELDNFKYRIRTIKNLNEYRKLIVDVEEFKSKHKAGEAYTSKYTKRIRHHSYKVVEGVNSAFNVNVPTWQVDSVINAIKATKNEEDAKRLEKEFMKNAYFIARRSRKLDYEIGHYLYDKFINNASKSTEIKDLVGFKLNQIRNTYEINNKKQVFLGMDNRILDQTTKEFKWNLLAQEDALNFIVNNIIESNMTEEQKYLWLDRYAINVDNFDSLVETNSAFVKAGYEWVLKLNNPNPKADKAGLPERIKVYGLPTQFFWD
ncbi:GA module-containing protein [Ureaplasma canigenitalium]|uniref:GA module-containing protein n=1 Tax=Ureaplasma canigenitalium TaxID=42092 RepID=UPI0004E26FE6|nr:GA module-containing protein [Ureaplasma canigenitalium]